MPATAPSITPPAQDEIESGHSLWQDAWHRLCKNKLAIIGFGFVLLLGLVSVFAPFITSKSYQDQNLALGPTPPGTEHWLGTDQFGLNMYSRPAPTVYPSRLLLLVVNAAGVPAMLTPRLLLSRQA